MYDDDLPEIPKNVLQRAHDEGDYLVRFYDKSDLWCVCAPTEVERINLVVVLSRAWIPPDMLKLLGEIDGKGFRSYVRLLCRDLNVWFVELDQDMLATNSKRQKWKSAAIRAECRHSYK